MEAFCIENQIEYNPYAWQVHRLEMYAKDGKTGKLVPLDHLDR